MVGGAYYMHDVLSILRVRLYNFRSACDVLYRAEALTSFLGPCFLGWLLTSVFSLTVVSSPILFRPNFFGLRLIPP